MSDEEGSVNKRPSLEDLRLAVLEQMQDTNRRQQEAVRQFFANANQVMAQMSGGETVPGHDALEMLSAARDRLRKASDPEAAADAAQGVSEADADAVLRAAEEALQAVLATEVAPEED